MGKLKQPETMYNLLKSSIEKAEQRKQRDIAILTKDALLNLKDLKALLDETMLNAGIAEELLGDVNTMKETLRAIEGDLTAYL